MAVDRNFWNEETQVVRSRNTQWSFQGKPGSRDWQAWRRILRVSVCVGNQRQFLLRLGAFLKKTADEELVLWKWF